ncbi:MULTISPECIES: phage minor head protein [Clostridia]|uniref:phage minor head protein n=1 Tax=Clostridia TaxID=186801 RepID=UPI002A900F43|nr:phage minor head protein [Peptostreptococcus porci]MDY5098787.1 phage minor head protein [Clostridium sp.]MDY5437452.1 phage minor head protein [Peptostreptococcus porci]
MNREQKFMESIYDESYEEIKKFEVARDNTKNEIFQLIGYAIITYGNKIKSIRAKRYIVTSVLSMLAKDDKEVDEFLNTQLMLNADKVCGFYGYKLSQKEKQEIVDKAFIGLTYKDRKKQHDESRKNKIHKLLIGLILGKITLEKTKHNKKAFNKLMDKEFKSYINKMKNIIISETTRIRNDIYLYQNKGKKVQYCSILEKNTCADCRDLDGEIFLAEEVYDLIPMHTNCKCYWVVVEEK